MGLDTISWAAVYVALAAGAACLLLVVDRARLEKQYLAAKAMAEKDSLTQLHNHGAFNDRLSVELERSARYERELAVIMIDLDGFKGINDAYGHPVGDRALRMTASVLCDHIRKSDLAARCGGDEFAVILPETDLEAAGVIAGRISAGIGHSSLVADDGKGVTFTVSIGYAACRPDSPDRNDILVVADRLMFESKRNAKGGVRGMQI